MTRHGNGATERRERPRFKLFMPATMAVADETLRVHVLDLSGSGAQVHGPRALPPGTAIRLDCAGRMRLGVVTRARARRYGIAFAMALTEDQVAGVVAEQSCGARSATV